MSENIGRFRQLYMPALIVGLVAVVFALIVWHSGTTGRCPTGLCRTSVDDFGDTMSALQKTDPKLLQYTESRRISTRLGHVRGIALDKDGAIYVAGDYGIRIFKSNGANIRDISLGSEPYCVSVAPDGTIYVGMKDHVEVLDRNGKLVSSWSPPSKRAYLTSISAAVKDVWVADAGDRAVIRYSTKGVVTGMFGVKDPSRNAPGLILPSPHLDVAAAPGGSVWISNPGRHQLELYTPDGRMKRSWGKESFGIDGFSGCCNPTDFAILPDGRFVTSEKGLPRVKVYGANGVFQCVVAGREALTPDVVGLDIVADARGRILVLDPASKSVRVFLSNGKAAK